MFRGAERLMVDSESNNTALNFISERKKQRPLFGQVTVSLLVYLAAIDCGLTGGYSAILLPQLRANESDLHIDDNMASWIVSIYSGATSMGCLMSGATMNLVGRRISVLLALSSMGIGWILIAFANSHNLILFGRAVDGFGKGLCAPSLTFHLEEMADPRLRGSLIACVLVSYSLGIMMVSVLGTTLNWRMTAVLGAGFSLLTLLGYFFLPESPVWLVRNKRVQKARKVFKWLWNGKNLDKVEDDLQELLKRVEEENDELKTNGSSCLIPQIKELLKPQYLKPFFIIHVSNMLQIICGTNMFIFYASDIISALNGNANLDVSFKLVFISAVRVVFLIVSCIFLLWFNRRSMCISSGIGSGMAALAIALAASMNFFNDWFMFLLLIVYVAFNTYGFFVLPPAMIGEILPSRIRSFAGAYIFTMNDVGMFAATKFFPFLINSVGIDGIFWIFGWSSLTCSLFIYFVLPETKNRTLVEIEKYFLQKNIMWIRNNKECEKAIVITEEQC